MSHDGNSCPNQSVNSVEHLGASTFDLYGPDTSLLHRAATIEHCTLDARLIREKRHVDDDQRALHSPTHGRCMINHVVQRDGECRWKTHHRRANRIANENGIDSGFVDKSPEQRIVCGHDYKLLALALALGKIANCDRSLGLRLCLSQRASS